MTFVWVLGIDKDSYKEITELSGKREARRTAAN